LKGRRRETGALFVSSFGNPCCGLAAALLQHEEVCGLRVRCSQVIEIVHNSSGSGDRYQKSADFCSIDAAAIAAAFAASVAFWCCPANSPDEPGEAAITLPFQ
jgi:hypothetical protein